jgi:hypothetical protein
LIGEWLQLARPSFATYWSPYSDLDGTVPQLQIAIGAGSSFGGLLSFLALTLLMNVAGTRHIELCRECGRPYMSTRRLPSKMRSKGGETKEVNHYCEDHRYLANRDRVYASRRRKLSESSNSD